MAEEIKSREPCPKCVLQKGQVSRNNLTIYPDGKYCQSCGYLEGKGIPLIPGTIVELATRGINKQTCERYNVRVAQNNYGYLETIFPIYDNGKVVRQKIKSQSDKKQQRFTGSKTTRMFGMNLYSPTKKLPILITEGEEDCLALSQMMPNLPVISITSGAKGAEKQLLANLEWLSEWKEVILCFDNDAPGQDAVSKCVGIFQPGTIRSAVFPLKDANEMLLAGRIEDAKKAIAAAETIKPSTIVFVEDILSEVLKKPSYGTQWPWDFMTKITYGCRLGEVYMLAGDTSSGKTQMMYQIVSTWLREDCKVGLIDLERQNQQTVQRIIAGMINKRIYLPDCNDFDIEEISKEIEKISGKLALYRPESGKISLESILINIRYLNKGYKINYFVVDNLTALSSNVKDMKDYEFASYATGQLVQLAKELNVLIFIINHIVKDPIKLQADITMADNYQFTTNKEGLSWETGRMPEAGHLYGGGKVIKLPDYVIVISRNRMSADDDEHRTIRVKFLKTRFESSFEGHEFRIIYDFKTGQLKERVDYDS
ncbi:Archaeal primase DnaG/twinkle, TOPRIM domain [uncultured Caudovirales phage]|uniref:Archaeal primase DnaG/twinkle, TOPRIM domain n=1 Tax=uncultured Caudovirales phage TaxID=2100421 RepID=A0A6J5KHP9_9CAUD|nr:Archaeal primase DnaG/twinkle, TOPRIM domain [uncultured Caudovirales phage]